jgi:hypothetical protein
MSHTRNSKSQPRAGTDLLPKLNKKFKKSRGASLTVPRTLEVTNRIDEEFRKVDIKSIRKKMMIFK